MKSLVESIFSDKKVITSNSDIWKGFDKLINDIEESDIWSASYAVKWTSKYNETFIKSLYPDINVPVTLAITYRGENHHDLLYTLYKEDDRGDGARTAITVSVASMENRMASEDEMKRVETILKKGMEIIKKHPDFFNIIPANYRFRYLKIYTLEREIKKFKA